eukprot:762820-Hanusia_phi.AAC.4
MSSARVVEITVRPAWAWEGRRKASRSARSSRSSTTTIHPLFASSHMRSRATSVSNDRPAPWWRPR